MPNTQAKILRSLDTLSFEDLALKPTAVEGTEPRDATEGVFGITARRVDVGFWECSPGRFTTSRIGVNEIILVLDGRATLVSHTGERLDHQRGDLVLIPDGWTGVWEIHEHFRKQYVTITV